VLDLMQQAAGQGAFPSRLVGSWGSHQPATLGAKQLGYALLQPSGNIPVSVLTSPPWKRIGFGLNTGKKKKNVFTKNATSRTTELMSPPQVYSEGLLPGPVRKKTFEK